MYETMAAKILDIRQQRTMTHEGQETNGRKPMMLHPQLKEEKPALSCREKAGSMGNPRQLEFIGQCIGEEKIQR